MKEFKMTTCVSLIKLKTKLFLVVIIVDLAAE